MNNETEINVNNEPSEKAMENFIKQLIESYKKLYSDSECFYNNDKNIVFNN